MMSFLISVGFITMAIIGHAQALKCHEQFADLTKGTEVCGSLDDNTCSAEDCDGTVRRGCGKCLTGEPECSCHECSQDMCNGGEIKNKAIKCYAQFADSSITVKQCSTFVHENICSKTVCDELGEFRDCGKCFGRPFCTCEECTGEKCNHALGAYSIAQKMFRLLALLVSLSIGIGTMAFT